MIIDNLEFIQTSTSKIQGGGFKKYHYRFRKAAAIASVVAMAKGTQFAEAITSVKTMASVNPAKHLSQLSLHMCLVAKD